MADTVHSNLDRDHVLSADCWCNPTVETVEDLERIHHAAVDRCVECGGVEIDHPVRQHETVDGEPDAVCLIRQLDQIIDAMDVAPSMRHIGSAGGGPGWVETLRNVRAAYAYHLGLHRPDVEPLDVGSREGATDQGDGIM